MGRVKKVSRIQAKAREAQSAFERADADWEAGRLKAAFKGFKELAEAGDVGCCVNVGYFFDNGIGTHKNRKQALRWYRRAYAGGHSSGAINIGIHYRQRDSAKTALKWFRRAMDLGDDSGALQTAMLLMKSSRNSRWVEELLKVVQQSDRVSVAENEEADRLLKSLTPRKRLASANRDSKAHKLRR